MKGKYLSTDPCRLETYELLAARELRSCPGNTSTDQRRIADQLIAVEAIPPKIPGAIPTGPALYPGDEKDSTITAEQSLRGRAPWRRGV